MENKELCKDIQNLAYNVIFGAKTNFSTYDIIEKVPGIINFISMSFGILSLAFDSFSIKFLSAIIIIFGISSLYISFYEDKKDIYKKEGDRLIQLFNRLNKLYRKVKNNKKQNLKKYEKELSSIENEYYPSSIAKQILFSGCFAHFKLFVENKRQIEWLEEERAPFKLLSDKIPSSFIFICILFIIIAGIIIFSLKVKFKFNSIYDLSFLNTINVYLSSHQ